MKVKIYTVKTADQIEFGRPAVHKLDAPSCSSDWYSTSEYILPAGYRVAPSNGLTTEIYDAEGRQCPLSDGDNFGNGHGIPHIVDIHAANHFTALKKCEEE